jgi:Bacterial SH3 domain
VKYRHALIWLPLLAATQGAHAETLYVIETVVVNVNGAPDTTGERVGTIKSGDSVEVIERQNDQIHVHLANGTEGWVRKSYLSTEEPLVKRLAERTVEVEKLKQDVARLEAAAGAAAASGRTATGTRAAATEPNTHGTTPPASSATGASASQPAATASLSTTDSTSGAETNAPAEPNAHEPPYFMTPPDAPAHPVWHWALGSFVVALGLGFLLGWKMLDGRIRRKYGGLRIY